MRAKEAPELDNMPQPERSFFWLAYSDLRDSRSVGIDVGGIPISEIKAYADMYDISCPVQITRLVRFVRDLDRVEREQVGRS